MGTPATFDGAPGSNISNVTIAVQESVSYRQTTNIVLIVLSFIIITFLSTALVILNKCKRIPFQIKWLSNGFIVSALLSDCFLSVMSIMFLTVDATYHNVIYFLRSIIVSCITNVSWGCSVLIALERLVALSIPLHYSSLVKRRRLAGLMVVMWAVCFVLPLTISVRALLSECGVYVQDCNTFQVLRPIRIYYTISFSIFLTCNLVSYVLISRIVKRHLTSMETNKIPSAPHAIPTVSGNLKTTTDKETKDNRRILRLTKTITSIILIFVCLHIIPIVHVVSFDVFPSLRLQVWQTIFHSASYMASYVNSLLCSYMYIWKIQECKMIFMKVFLRWNHKYRNEAERIRISVYDIVTRELNSSSSKP